MTRISIEIIRRLSLALVCIAGCSGTVETCHSETVMLSTSYQVDGRNLHDRGTGVCIANTDRGSLIVTCKHNVASNPDGVWVYHDHDWHECDRAILHDTEDLATVEVPIRLQPTPLADDSPIGEAISIEGAGPAAHRSDEPMAFGGRILSDIRIKGDDGQHVISGDSGGPVLFQKGDQPCVVGIVCAVEARFGPSRRRQVPGAVSRYISCRKINAWLVGQYGNCPHGICPIRIRPQIQQPMFGIGIPLGPPRIVDTIEPAPMVDPPVPCAPIVGPRGPAGPAGRDGRSVTREDVEAVVNAWLDSNAERLRGPAGPAGPPGNAADTTEVEQRLSDLEYRPFRLILASEGKVIDDETYAPGEPVVLDLQRLRNRSDAK